MKKITEYRFGDSLIIGVDHGYGNVKTRHTVTRTDVIKQDKKPAFSSNYTPYDGSYFIIGEGHKGFISDKQEDMDNYVLTLMAIAKELKLRNLASAKVHLAVGLPLKWVQAQREDFKRYLMQNRTAGFRYKGIDYSVEFTGCTVMPQCYSAVAENLRNYNGMNLLVDIGNGTMSVMYLNNGRAMESRAWTEKFGVSQCALKIRNRVLDETGTKMPDEVVENFLKTGAADVAELYAGLMKEAAAEYVAEIFQKLRDYDYNEKHLKECDDPFLSTREKEDSFVEGIISAVYERLFENLPELIGRYLLAQGGTAVRYGESQAGNKNHISVSDSRSDISESRSDYGSEDHGFENNEPEENELLDFGLFD